ncbi:hypothetical protein [Thalassotalea sp. Y01]|uniref:hypothetical protein n=1 Tax=Thalassotalea sp. Y01 TaxID=2729613 RepID=UPI00145EA700|nr:hypothetical protein [Thalassotalea sp. Y01]NMP17510.1 hypothetical protein [Thalassotalea sp. Y01]
MQTQITVLPPSDNPKLITASCHKTDYYSDYTTDAFKEQNSRNRQLFYRRRKTDLQHTQKES